MGFLLRNPNVGNGAPDTRSEIASRLVFRNRLALARDSVGETGYTWKSRGILGGSSATLPLQD
jgi:hypothetical protein